MLTQISGWLHIHDLEKRKSTCEEIAEIPSRSCTFLLTWFVSSLVFFETVYLIFFIYLGFISTPNKKGTLVLLQPYVSIDDEDLFMASKNMETVALVKDVVMVSTLLNIQRFLAEPVAAIPFGLSKVIIYNPDDQYDTRDVRWDRESFLRISSAQMWREQFYFPPPKYPLAPSK